VSRKLAKARRKERWGRWLIDDGWDYLIPRYEPARRPARQPYGGSAYYGFGPYPDDWAWVTPQLATGGLPTTRREMTNLVKAGITHVVCVAGDMPSVAHRVEGADGRVNFLYNPTDDDGKWKPRDWFERTARFVAPAIEAGEKAYVHCIAGSNRGPSSAYYVLRATGTPQSDAEALIRAARPRARLLYLEDAEAALAAEDGA
jgi:hypothetical protein